MMQNLCRSNKKGSRIRRGSEFHFIQVVNGETTIASPRCKLFLSKCRLSRLVDDYLFTPLMDSKVKMIVLVMDT